MSFLIFGARNGWIGGMIVDLLKKSDKEYYISESRLEDRNNLQLELDKIKPKYILNCAGVVIIFFININSLF
jgi:3,5-epimerase/4-reductase